MSERGPEPTSILTQAAAVENLVTWIIATRITADRVAFGHFMRFVADRIPVDDKTRMLAAIVEEEFPDGDARIHEGLAEDLRAINEVRRYVAHAVYVAPDFDELGEGYVMFRRGQPKRLPDEELRTQTSDALARVTRVSRSLARIAEHYGDPFGETSISGSPAI